MFGRVLLGTFNEGLCLNGGILFLLFKDGIYRFGLIGISSSNTPAK